MANAKGTDIVSLRKIFSRQSRQIQHAFLQKLSLEQIELFQKMSCLKWAPLPTMLSVYEIAAEALFPNDPEGMFKLGKQMAAASYNLVYRFFLNFPPIDFIAKSAAQVWTTYHDCGIPSVSKVAPNCYDFVVKDYPDMAPQMLIITKAHLITVLEIVGRKNITVDIFDYNPSAWRWRATWDEA